MKQTEKTLLEQMKISEFEIAQRKHLFSLTSDDIKLLKASKPLIDRNLDYIVQKFYELQTENPEIALLIGDADTLQRLAHAQRKYVVDLFSGLYDLEYVNNRLRIGLVHKRIGVEPKLYLSAIYTLKSLLNEALRDNIQDQDIRINTLNALEKLMYFDITLVFDTYIRSLLSEIEIEKEKSDQYAMDLEEKIKERTMQLEEMSRTDPLTGLLNVRHLNDTLTSVLRAAQRRSEPVCFAYIDINDLKKMNDTKGHQFGDEILKMFAQTVRAVSRAEDSCFRYGGDEFCVILPNCESDAAIDIYKKRLEDEIEKRSNFVSYSIGVIQTGPQDYLETEELIRQADDLMYHRKEQAKQRQTSSDVLELRHKKLAD
ncbi:diguanylate cyclase [Litoribrevibacter albus]|uniref:Diguanylate cyclase DosC n=1 Tax=Litoribrevibacter albus TaxID=1473156 RepID=A0AA37S894_9GAMM|nr:diguanylate cyclase [Litoribrevibacter albus]GLQ29898.1 sensor histidine kinase [Litoribrevibacter albus]